MHSLLTSYVGKSIHHANSLSPEFFAVNSNRTEITTYASQDLMNATWDELLYADSPRLPTLQSSKTCWRVFRLEVLEGGDPCGGEFTGLYRRIKLFR